MTRGRPSTTKDLRPSERRMIAAIRTLGFGRFEYLRIERGGIVLNPWPTSVREVEFGSQYSGAAKAQAAEFELKPQVAELFEYVREVDAGEIRTLEVRSGLPFSMEIEMAGGHCNG